MSQQVYANPQNLYVQTLPVQTVVASASGVFSPAIPVTYQYVVNGFTVTIFLPALSAAASGAPSTILNLGGLPPAIIPTRLQAFPIVLQNGTNFPIGYARIASGSLSVVFPSATNPPDATGFLQQSFSYSIY
jgi:hypothetical protein